jgi:protein phosphatase
MLRAYGVTDKGPVRQINEDCFAVDELLHLLVVADGMGGHSAGEIASRTAVDAIRDYVSGFHPSDPWPFGFDPGLSQAGNVLKNAVHVANARVFELASVTPAYAGMGTTIVAMLVRDDVLTVAHAGDSRAYLMDGQGLIRLTRDDTWVASVLAQDPNADPTLLKHHPMRHALTNVVGSRPATSVHVREVPLRGGERLVLTTDGVHGAVDDDRLADLLAPSTAGKAAADALLNEALAAGSRDNCTVVVADYTVG